MIFALKLPATSWTWLTAAALAGVSVPAVAKTPGGLTVTGGENHFCVLDAEGAKCWGGASRRQPTVGMMSGPCATHPDTDACKDDDRKIAPEFVAATDPEGLWAGGENTCLQDGAELRCWGRTPSIAVAPPSRDIQQVALSQTHACLYDASGFKCWGQYVPLTLQRLTPDVELAPEAAATLGTFAVGSGETCVAAGRPFRCVSIFQGGGPQLAFGTAGKSLVAMSHLHFCTVYQLRFESSDGDGYESDIGCAKLAQGQVSSSLLANATRTLATGEITQLAMSEQYACWVVAGTVTCSALAGDDAKPGLARSVTGWADIRQIAVVQETICGVDDFALHCRNLSTGEDVAVPDFLSVNLFDFRLAHLPVTLKQVERYVYQDKQAVLKAAAEGAESLADDGRLFLLHALAPFIRGASTPFITDRVVPMLDSALAQADAAAGINNMADLHPDQASKVLGLRLMELAVREESRQAGDSGDRAALEALIPAIGRELAAGSLGDTPAFRAAFAAVRPTLERHVQDSRLAAFAGLIESLGEVYAPRAP